MKYHVALELKGNKLPADYRRTVISFFKKAISEYMDGAFYKELYDNGANSKSLTWSIRFSKPNFDNGVMRVADTKVDMTLKISDVQTALVYYSALLGMKDKKFNIGMDNAWVLKKIRLVKEFDIEEEIVGFKVLSPICIRRHNRDENKDNYITVEDAGFAMEINRKLKEELPYMAEKIDTLEYDFSGLKKTFVPAFAIFIPVSVGSFYIKGDKNILDHINKTGLGSRRNAGFGLVEGIMR